MSECKQPESTQPEAPKRDAQGRWLKGTTGNAGGIPAEALELRRLALTKASRAMERAFELMEDPDPKAADIGISHVLNRALGRVGAPAELPDDAPTTEALDTSPAALLALSMRGLARVLDTLDKRQSAGHPLSQPEVETLTDASRTLAALAKEERELEKASAAGKLSDAALQAQVLAAVPREVLEQELARRTPPEAA